MYVAEGFQGIRTLFNQVSKLIRVFLTVFKTFCLADAGVLSAIVKLDGFKAPDFAFIFTIVVIVIAAKAAPPNPLL